MQYILITTCACVPYIQLKNMINALYSSQRGTKSFKIDAIEFAITDMYKCECELGLARIVPQLRESCDAWTKLNVAPAKVMQVQ